MIRFSNEEGFLELTTVDENGSGMMFPLLVRVTEIISLTDVSHIQEEDMPRNLKGVKTVILIRGVERGVGVIETFEKVVDQIRRP